MAAAVLAQNNANRLRDALERFGMEAVDTRDAIVDEQGINSIEELFQLDEPGIVELCRTVRKPGGGDAGQNISTKSETLLKLTIYYLQYLDNTSKPHRYDALTVRNVRSIKDLKA